MCLYGKQKYIYNKKWLKLHKYFEFRLTQKFSDTVIVKKVQGAPEEKTVSERTHLSRKYILEDYKTCGQLYILV